VKVVVISASPRREGKTQHVMRAAHERALGSAESTFINVADSSIDCYRGPGEEYGEATRRAAEAIMGADAWIIGTPIYNSFFSSALKNLFEYVDYKKTAGKVAGMAIVASGEIGFVDVQTLLTQLLSYFRVIANPKAVYVRADSVGEGGALDSGTSARVAEMVDETLALAARTR